LDVFYLVVFNIFLLFFAFFDVFNRNNIPFKLIFSYFLMAAFIAPILKGIVFGAITIIYYVLSKIYDLEKYFIIKNADLLFFLISFMFMDYIFLFLVLVLSLGIAYIYKLIVNKQRFGFNVFMLISSLLITIIYIL